MIFISLALPCLKRFINTSVKYVYVWHPRLWYHSQRPRPALADGAAFETVNRAACFKRFKQCFKSFCLKLFLCVSILADEPQPRNAITKRETGTGIAKNDKTSARRIRCIPRKKEWSLVSCEPPPPAWVGNFTYTQ